jgi:hypothetical protein
MPYICIKNFKLFAHKLIIKQLYLTINWFDKK